MDMARAGMFFCASESRTGLDLVDVNNVEAEEVRKSLIRYVVNGIRERER